MGNNTVISKYLIFIDHTKQGRLETNLFVNKIPPKTLKTIFKNKDHPSISQKKKKKIDKEISIFLTRLCSIFLYLFLCLLIDVC